MGVMSAVPVLLAAVAVAAAAPHPPSNFLFDQPTDLILAGGASVQSAPLYSLRSGNPGRATSAALRAVLNPGATVSRVSFAYRYDTGFGPTGVGANFTLRIAGQPVYTSPHLTEYSYANRTNYSQPVAVDAQSLAIVVPQGLPVEDNVQFQFENNGRNVQLLLPLTVTVECSGAIPCTPPPPPPPSHVLLFEHAPSIVAGPECPWVLGSGPWWDKVHPLSDTHALGWAESHLIATTDSGRTWDTPSFNDSRSCPLCDAKTAYAIYPRSAGGADCGGNDCGDFHTLGEQNETAGSKSNITGVAAVASTRYLIETQKSLMCFKLLYLVG